jgi:uncharacterized protein
MRRLQRRRLLHWVLGAAGLITIARVSAQTPGPGLRLGAAWRGPAQTDAHHAGVLAVDWHERRVWIEHATRLPSRPHGLLAEPDGGLLVLAARPGAWMLRLDAQGQVQTQRMLDSETPSRRLDGHVCMSTRGDWLYTTETDAQGQGWVSVRDRRDLRRQDQWPTHGVDPHHLLLDHEGHLMVANGGIARTPDGNKRDLHLMASSLVRLNTRNGELLGRWALPDARLSMRHLAWHTPHTLHLPHKALLGVALQAEHDDPAQRAAAPLLALWDGQSLDIPVAQQPARGYAGDITAVGSGGFVLSAQRAHQAHHWSPSKADAMQRIAEVQEPCALAADPQGAVLMACGAGVARWHPSQDAAMLRWPEAMALDNHWVLMPSANL